MKFMLLLYGEEGTWERATEEERAAVYEEFGALDEALREAGKLPVEGYELASSRQAKTLRQTAAGPKVLDGPFAEAAEQLGGYYVIDCADVDEALEWAARIPGSDGAVEVRPVVEYTG